MFSSDVGVSGPTTLLSFFANEVCEYMVGDEDSGPEDKEDQELNKEIRKRRGTVKWSCEGVAFRRRGMDSYSQKASTSP